MGYSSKIKQSREKAYNQSIATKILDMLDKLRLDENNNSPRRWIWELMQNAKDVAYKDIDLEIEIDFKSDDKVGFVEFKHNGKPFTIDNLTFLIEQISTKDRRKNKGEMGRLNTTGKFGTGFLTTHLLSEEVQIESVLKEPDEPYKKFDLLLDRSGRDIDTIKKSVNNSLKSLKNIDSNPSYDDYSPEELNTVFRYNLDKNGIKVAEKGIKDLYNSLIFTLVFLPEIKSVVINDNSDKNKYKISQEKSDLGNGIVIYTITRTNPQGKFKNNIAVLSNNYTTIAVEIEYKDDQVYLKEFSHSTPKLFCDFPLIGTEDFSYPVIINNPIFNLNEQRNGVYLTNKPDDKIKENKEIIFEASNLYYKLLKEASNNNWGNVFLLAKIPPVVEREWISKEWFENEILKPIREELLVTPIIDTENHERVSIITENNNTNIWFPSSSRKKIRKNIWELASLWKPNNLPNKADVDKWYNILWSGCERFRLTSEEITKAIEERKNLNTLEEELKKADSIDWLNSYYTKILNSDKDILRKVINDEYAVIPNQIGNFIKKSELRIDNNIEEELKNVLSILGVDSREYLKHREINPGLSFPEKNQAEVINEINNIIKERFGKDEKIIKACNYLVTLFSNDNKFPEKRENVYKFCNDFYPDEFSKKRIIKKWSKNLWQEVDKIQLRRIVKDIAETNNIQTLTSNINLMENDSQTLSWISDYVSFLTEYDFDNLLNLKKAPILPNQNGNFKIKDNLFLDNGDIDDKLKEISADLGYDFREELLDVNICLDLPENRIKKEIDVAEEITRLINLRVREYPRAARTDETKKIFNKLYLWFNSNKEKAEKLFSDLYENKHILYDDEQIAENMQKAEKLSILMEKYDITDLSKLEQVLNANKIKNLLNQQNQITKETLASLGVTSIEEWEEALKDKDIAAQFNHISTPTNEMFNYAQKYISRAKTNVIKYLKTLPSYDCSELEEVATTVIGGIKKDGLNIHVVIRPSDNGEVILYYNSEKDTLDYIDETNAELWIDDGVNDPRHLTLGKILKTTGITRIPV